MQIIFLGHNRCVHNRMSHKVKKHSLSIWMPGVQPFYLYWGHVCWHQMVGTVCFEWGTDIKHILPNALIRDAKAAVPSCLFGRIVLVCRDVYSICCMSRIWSQDQPYQGQVGKIIMKIVHHLSVIIWISQHHCNTHLQCKPAKGQPKINFP